MRIFSQSTSDGMPDLVVYYPGQSGKEYVLAYYDAAMRLASTFKGQANDDLVLLPFLTLFRHAFELQLKITIKDLVALRIEFGEGLAADLDSDRSDEALKAMGHNLHKLLNIVEIHYEGLKLPQPFPESVKSIIMKIHEADHDGTAFRYSGLLGGVQERIDFPGFADRLSKEFILLESISEYAGDSLGQDS